MPGSKAMFNLPQEDYNQHPNLQNRNAPLQHNLQSIYRESDGKSLYDILNEMALADNSIVWELITVTETTSLVTLTTFSFNMARDQLWVSRGGIDVYEGSDLDYVKISGTQIQFNYNLNPGDKIAVVLAGIKNTSSFGGDIYNALNKFIQLTDVPSSYHTKGGKYVKVNDSETGLIFDNAIANTSLNLIEYDITTTDNTTVDSWIPFVNKGIIKGIKITGSETAQLFDFSIWTKVSGYWIYYSGDVNNILWDIMDIPFVDESGQDSIYVSLNNKGAGASFHIQIYVVL